MLSPRAHVTRTQRPLSNPAASDNISMEKFGVMLEHFVEIVKSDSGKCIIETLSKSDARGTLDNLIFTGTIAGVFLSVYRKDWTQTGAFFVAGGGLFLMRWIFKP